MKTTTPIHDSASHHWLVFDPIPFSGGSKVATKEILNLCPGNLIKLTILCADKDDWNEPRLIKEHQVEFASCHQLGALQSASNGWRYWLKQLCYTLMVLWQMIKQPNIDTVIGASGPGVDMALYLGRLIFRYRLIQFVHGPVAASRSIGYCLSRADKVFYLADCRDSMQKAIERYYQSITSLPITTELAQFNISSPHFYTFRNGIGEQRWPTPCIYGEPTIFWAASLLKWKGLEILVEAGSILNQQIPVDTHVCYIRPKNTRLDVSEAPLDLDNFYWYQQPDNLDEIRSRCSIYISTSTKEPFGLSVLEGMAAGMCVFIPRDGAYWDQTLTHNLNCIKYTPGSASSLASELLQVIIKPERIVRIGLSAMKAARQYRAEKCYGHIIHTLTESNPQHPDTIRLPERAS